MRKNKIFILVTVFLVTITFVSVVFLSNKASSKSYAISTEGQPFLGNKTASVNMIIFSDFKCPSCKLFHDTILKSIEKQYVSKGKLKIYSINLPILGSDSITAAQVGEAIYEQNPAAFWIYYDSVYQNQKSENKKWATVDYLINLSKKNIKDIDYSKLKKDISSPEIIKKVNTDKKIAKDLGISGTPTIFINGKKINKITMENINQKIQKDLKK